MEEGQKAGAAENGCLFEVEYRTNREDVMAGLSLLNRARYPRRWLFPAACGLIAVALLWVSGALAAVFLAGALYGLYSRWLRPWLRHRGLAGEIAGKNASYRLRVFEKGISVTEGEAVHRIFYKDLSYAEGKGVFLLVCQQSFTVILPKRFLGEHLEQARALFARTMERIGTPRGYHRKIVVKD